MSETLNDADLFSTLYSELEGTSDRATLSRQSGKSVDAWVQTEFAAPVPLEVLASNVREIGYWPKPRGGLLWIYRLIDTDNCICLDDSKRNQLLRYGKTLMAACLKVQQ